MNRQECLRAFAGQAPQAHPIPLYAPDPATRQMLLVDNPARLFKFT